MASLKEYFEKNRYKPTYFIGDRVSGRWNGIPFTGSIGNDGLVSEDVGPQITVILDLPIVVDHGYKSIVTVKHSDIKPLKNLTDEKL